MKFITFYELFWFCRLKKCLLNERVYICSRGKNAVSAKENRFSSALVEFVMCEVEKIDTIPFATHVPYGTALVSKELVHSKCLPQWALLYSRRLANNEEPGRVLSILFNLRSFLTTPSYILSI